MNPILLLFESKFTKSVHFIHLEFSWIIVQSLVVITILTQLSFTISTSDTYLLYALMYMRRRIIDQLLYQSYFTYYYVKRSI